MAVVPHGRGKANLGRRKDEIAHAERLQRLQTKRLYRLAETRPRSFTPQQKRELKHRVKYRETRNETYQRLQGRFSEGKLTKSQWDAFKHALDMKQNWKDYRGYKKYQNEGLKSLSGKEFRRADKFVDFNFDYSSVKALNKLENKGLGKLTDSEFNSLKRIPGVEISQQEWQRARRVNKAKNKGLIEQRGGSLYLTKDSNQYSESEKALLRKIGFNV